MDNPVPGAGTRQAVATGEVVRARGVLSVGQVELHRAFAVEVRRFVTEHHRRRRIATTLHLGVPGGLRRVVTEDPAWDYGLRTDLLVRLLGQEPEGRPRALWLTRSGEDAVRDADLAWLRAARAAAAAHGQPLGSFAVVTRSGWLDLLTDESRTWVRTRPLRPGASR